MASDALALACNCKLTLRDSFLKYYCQNCARIFCGKCVKDCGSLEGNIINAGSDTKTKELTGVGSCKYCLDHSTLPTGGRRYSDKIYPDESPSYGLEPLSPPHIVTKSSVTSYASPLSIPHSSDRSDDDEGEFSISNLFSPSTEYCLDVSDIETSSVRSRHECYSLRSVGSSPFDSPSGIYNTYTGAGDVLQQDQQRANRSPNDGFFDNGSMLEFRKPEYSEATDVCADVISIFQEQYANIQIPLDFESNGLIWLPPPPEDESEDTDNNFFTYDDDQDGEIGDLSSSVWSSNHVVSRRPVRAALQENVRAVVSQLLKGEGVKVGGENGAEDWNDIVSAVSWQAANFVKPDTSKGESMDPIDYIKIKCVASGVPRDSMLIKGVVCTKNIKHKRMTSQHKNPKLLLLGGALEFQGVANQLESFDVLRQQEIDHLKKIVSKIEALQANVLLVEKSVSSYAQEYLLAKDISLVLNVKRVLLERIGRCTGARIAPSVDKISTAQLGYCKHFRLEKFNEEHEPVNQLNKKPSKTLMFFEGCPRPLGCTVLLKGSCREELQKVKQAIKFAVFAAYHLCLENSFLADEGATLPKLTMYPSNAVMEKIPAINPISPVMDPFASDHSQDLTSEFQLPVSKDGNLDVGATCMFNGCNCNSDICSAPYLHLTSDIKLDQLFLANNCHPEDNFPGDLTKTCQQERQPSEIPETSNIERVGQPEMSLDYYRSSDTSESILVSFSSHCILNETVCERSRLLRFKYYSSSDKPLGRYLQDNLFYQTSSCQSCKEPAEAHVLCYTHKQGNLTINVRRLPSVKLPGEHDKKIWMWHRCLRCAYVDGIPPASHRVVMSEPAWGLSFGKFLELSFSNHTTGNRVAKCGHSLQRDCLRYYGCGSMVAFFRYSPVDIRRVCLPPSILEFSVPWQDWISKEAAEFLRNAEALYAEMSAVLRSLDRKIPSSAHEFSDPSELHNHVLELNDLLAEEVCYYHDMIKIAGKENSYSSDAQDILQLNRLRHSLLIGSHVWDCRFDFLESLLKNNSRVKVLQDTTASHEPKDSRNQICLKDNCFKHNCEESLIDGSAFQKNSTVKAVHCEQDTSHTMPCRSGLSDESFMPVLFENKRKEEMQAGESKHTTEMMQRAPSAAYALSDTIDSAWSGLSQPQGKVQLHTLVQADTGQKDSFRQMSETRNSSCKRLSSPAGVCSFDSAVRLQERNMKGLPASLHKSLYDSGDFRSMIRDPALNVQRSISEISSREAERLDVLPNSSPSFISSASLLSDGARLMVAQNRQNDVVIAVYDDDPMSIVSYALSLKEHEDWVRAKTSGADGFSKETTINSENPAAYGLPSWHSFGSLDLDYMNYGSYGSEDSLTRMGSFFADKKASPHLNISFADKSSHALGKVTFSVTCYFAKEFDALRRKCCPTEVDFIRSISRCKPWSAQGGKSDVTFAKSLDERFIIKQVTKTELVSFQEFSTEYFKYLTESLNSGSPTCLAKVIGIYRVSQKYLKGGKETKMDYMVTENLFFKRKISRVYDLKGSTRSRYIQDSTEPNKVLQDMNLLETLRTKPIFLGSKAKRSLERAVWNDTSLLASIDVMDYSLLVGVDDENKQLVIGIIDFMRQYTWDKHLETWVKASGLLGGPKNVAPTIISPKQYKKRFRKAMTAYFLGVPDQWTS